MKQLDNGAWEFEVGDELLADSTYQGLYIATVTRLTATQAVLDNGIKLKRKFAVLRDGTHMFSNVGAYSYGRATYTVATQADKDAIAVKRRLRKLRKWYRDFNPTAEQLKEIYIKYNK